jgi:hypothetical protein
MRVLAGTLTAAALASCAAAHKPTDAQQIKQALPQRVSLLRSRAAWRIAAVPGLGG